MAGWVGGVERGGAMSTTPETPVVSHFKFATTRRDENGFEFVLVAKSMEDLRRAYTLAGDTSGKFDEGKVNTVRIKRA